MCTFNSFKYMEVWRFLFGPILVYVSFALEENVSSRVVMWIFYKCHQVKSYEFDNFPATLIVDLPISPFSSIS